MEEIHNALEAREVDGALVDTYVAAEHQDQLLKHGVRVSRVLDRSFGYGIVLSGEAANVKKGFDDYIKNNMKQILAIIEEETQKLPVRPPCLYGHSVVSCSVTRVPRSNHATRGLSSGVGCGAL